jgi:hypothetical protein
MAVCLCSACAHDDQRVMVVTVYSDDPTPAPCARLIPGGRHATRQPTSPAHPTAARGEDDAQHRRCRGIPRCSWGGAPAGPALKWRFEFPILRQWLSQLAGQPLHGRCEEVGVGNGAMTQQPSLPTRPRGRVAPPIPAGRGRHRTRAAIPALPRQRTAASGLRLPRCGSRQPQTMP